jgi:hypothetical protein
MKEAKSFNSLRRIGILDSLVLKDSTVQKLRRVDSPQRNTSSVDRNNVETGLDLICGGQKSSSSNNNKRIWLYDSVFQTLAPVTDSLLGCRC